jgi:hypothetical protein
MSTSIVQRKVDSTGSVFPAACALHKRGAWLHLLYTGSCRYAVLFLDTNSDLQRPVVVHHRWLDGRLPGYRCHRQHARKQRSCLARFEYLRTCALSMFNKEMRCSGTPRGCQPHPSWVPAPTAHWPNPSLIGRVTRKRAQIPLLSNIDFCLPECYC